MSAKYKSTRVPHDYLRGFFQNWKFDVVAGFVVALMALPMSLGIAIASGFPPISGVITAIIGGIVVSFISGSHLTIKGPAGGLSAIAFGAVVALGEGNIVYGYQFALATIVIAGLLQMIFGVIKLGEMGDFFPASTIHGMLASLGIIMAVKQIHSALGVNPVGHTPLELLIEIPKSIESLNPKIALIGLVTLLILIVIPYIKNRFTAMFPAPLLALIIVIPLTFALNIQNLHTYSLGPKTYTIDPYNFLVNIPENLFKGILFPDFSKIFTLDSLQYILMFALAGSIESLLSTKAIDKIDPYKRFSNQNRDLFAIGLGTAISGFLGGLPMISESKRSVININQGAKTRWANMFHGLFLLLLIVFALRLIKMIPYAALSAMLIYTGARMATPSEFSKSYKIGAEQFLVFIITLVVTFISNFLVGVSVGLITELIIHLKFGVTFSALFKNPLVLKRGKDESFEVVFQGPAIFSNYLGVRKILDNIPLTSNVTFDFSKATVVDHTFMEHLHSYENSRLSKGGQIAIAGLDYHKHLSDHPLAAKRIVKQNQLNDRQLEIREFAQENELLFDHRMISNTAKFDAYSISEHSTVKIEENVLKQFYRNHEIEISDILIEQGGNTVTRQDYKMTVLHITLPTASLPHFTLQKEGFVDTLFALSGFNDIDFEEFPNFSYYYLLKGPNELHIRNFFKEDIIRFFENNKGYHLEVTENTILVLKRAGLLSLEESKAMSEFAQKLVDVLIKKFDERN
jgi:MFS superfamily sulfate permease-like transporter